MPDPTYVLEEELQQAVGNHIRKLLAGISPGDVVEIHWLDASMSREVIKITDRIIATHKCTLGRFIGIFQDAQFSMPHLLLSTETTDRAAVDMTSIPAAVVVGVTKIASKALSLADFM
ncbi:hypothetical protein ES706_03507 [subsurface metagenome]